MADPMPTGSIVQVTVVGTYEAQRYLNVLHYKAKFAPDPTQTYTQQLTELANNINADAVTAWLPALREMIGPEATVDHLRLQKVYPGRDYYVDVNVGGTGLHANSVRTGNISCVITKQSERAGRGRSGSFHVFGVPDATFDAGVFLGPYLGLADDLISRLRMDQVDFGGDQVWQPGMYRGSIGAPLNWSAIVGMTAQEEVRIMRRRTLRVGI